jgi:D-beta-D-heptose 7-phosphate kinase/D-beta-D-heptose 1-phosphate adenosyltransferase
VTAKDPSAKIKGIHELVPILRAAQAQGHRVVFTNGCFDLLHRGHTRFLAEARALGDLLVVGLNSDGSVRSLKGPGRPIVTAEERAEVLAALAAVDYVTVFDESTPARLIEMLQPDVLVKGGDWAPDQIVGREAVERRGGQVLALPYVDGASTSGIIERILARLGERRP